MPTIRRTKPSQHLSVDTPGLEHPEDDQAEAIRSDHRAVVLRNRKGARLPQVNLGRCHTNLYTSLGRIQVGCKTVKHPEICAATGNTINIALLSVCLDAYNAS
jgi:hypothetical protein